MIRRALSGLADAESIGGAGLALAIRAASRACWAARWRVAWTAVVTLATVAMLAAAVWLAASVAVLGQ